MNWTCFTTLAKVQNKTMDGNIFITLDVRQCFLNSNLLEFHQIFSLIWHTDKATLVMGFPFSYLWMT